MSGLDTEHKVLPSNLEIEHLIRSGEAKAQVVTHSCSSTCAALMQHPRYTAPHSHVSNLAASIAALRAYGKFGKLFLAVMVPQHKHSARPYPCSCIRAARRFAPLKEKLFARIFA